MPCTCWSHHAVPSTFYNPYIDTSIHPFMPHVSNNWIRKVVLYQKHLTHTCLPAHYSVCIVYLRVWMGALAGYYSTIQAYTLVYYTYGPVRVLGSVHHSNLSTLRTKHTIHSTRIHGAGQAKEKREREQRNREHVASGVRMYGSLYSRYNTFVFIHGHWERNK